MALETNFYRLYKLASKDKDQALKSSIFALGIVACFALGSLFTLGLLQNFSWGILTGAIICWGLGFSLWVIFALTSHLKEFSLWNIALSASGFLPLFLSHQINKFLLIEIAVLFILFFVARMMITREYQILIRLNLWRIVRRGAFFLTVALVLILSTLIILQVKQSEIQQSGVKIWDFLISRTTQGIPQGVVPSVNLSGTVDDVLNNYVQGQSSQLGMEGMGSIMTGSILQNMKDSLSQMFHFPIQGNETIPGLIGNWLKTGWQTFPLALKLSIGFLVLLTSLSLLNLINSVFSIVIILGSSLLLQILISSKVIQIKHRNIEKEILEI